MKWEQYIDTYLFVDNYGTYLVDFLEKYLYDHSDSDSDKLDCFFAMYEKWKFEYLVCSKIFEIESCYDAWYTCVGFFKFSLPSNKEDHVEEWIEKIALLSLEFECDEEGEIKKEYYYQNCYPPYEVFREEFNAFNYAKEKCVKLTGLEAVDELQSIYDSSIERFQYRIKKDMHYKGMDAIGNNYPVFYSIIHFFETLQNEMIIRLNSSAKEAYLWYFVKTDSDFYILRISDFV